MTVYVYGIVLVFYSRFILVNNMVLPKDYQADKSMPEDLATSPEEVDTFNQTKNSAESYKDSSHVYGFMEKETHQNNEDAHSTETQKPCSVVVLSNVQNPSVQSLLRKYRYDANGTLIPSSVKYFIKVPKSRGHQAVLVPINDKAFSPLGGFVRYYKEVPPIPQTWK